MLRYILVAILIGFAFSNAYRTNHPKRQQYLIPQLGYGDYDYDYLQPAYAKDSNAANESPSIFSYWNNIFRNARLPKFNITNPFSKLFTPYVIKVDFPSNNDDIAEPISKPTRNKKKTMKGSKLQQESLYLNIEQESPEFFYDPVTQQYYEVQQTASQNYKPENNYYATTFEDDDEIIIDLGNGKREEEKNQEDGSVSEEEEEEEDQEYMAKNKKNGIVRIYNNPVIKRINVERSANNNDRKLLKRIKSDRLRANLNLPVRIY